MGTMKVRCSLVGELAGPLVAERVRRVELNETI